MQGNGCGECQSEKLGFPYFSNDMDESEGRGGVPK